MGSILLNQDVEAVSISERLRDKRVLLVEDNAVNAALASRFLSVLNMQVTLAENGLQAVQKASAQQFDVVLMDLQMPEMNGFEATQAILAQLRERAPPIIGCTASVLDQDKQACLDAGMVDHLAKPIKRERLLEVLLLWIRSAEARPSDLT
jgi:CheY-like chemotaxis protein